MKQEYNRDHPNSPFQSDEENDPVSNVIILMENDICFCLGSSNFKREYLPGINSTTWSLFGI